jgi:hypothetical protein
LELPETVVQLLAADKFVDFQLLPLRGFVDSLPRGWREHVAYTAPNADGRPTHDDPWPIALSFVATNERATIANTILNSIDLHWTSAEALSGQSIDRSRYSGSRNDALVRR